MHRPPRSGSLNQPGVAKLFVQSSFPQVSKGENDDDSFFEHCLHVHKN